jgi:hypothetical protein
MVDDQAMECRVSDEVGVLMLTLHPGAAVGPVKVLEEEGPTLVCVDVRLNIREVDELKERVEAAAITGGARLLRSDAFRSTLGNAAMIVISSPKSEVSSSVTTESKSPRSMP